MELTEYETFVKQVLGKYASQSMSLAEAISKLREHDAKSYAQALKDVGELLANITVQGNAVANELRIVELLSSLKRGEMPEEGK